jgi:hypothetical protein
LIGIHPPPNPKAQCPPKRRRRIARSINAAKEKCQTHQFAGDQLQQIVRHYGDGKRAKSEMIDPKKAPAPTKASE